MMPNAPYLLYSSILKVRYLDNLFADMQTFWDNINKGLMKQIPIESFGVEFSFNTTSPITHFPQSKQAQTGPIFIRPDPVPARLQPHTTTDGFNMAASGLRSLKPSSYPEAPALAA
jgi:hypothetical protein